MQTQKNFNSVSREQMKMHNFPVAPFYLSTDEKLCLMEALDHIHVTRQYQEMGCCVVCKKISLKKCSGCDTFYCSSECQTFDWPKHKANCSKQRECLSDRNSFASSIRKREGSSFKNLNEDSLMLTDRNSPFTALANQLSKKPTSMFNGNKGPASFKIGNRQYQNKERVPANAVREYKKTNSNRNDRKKKFSPKKSSSSSKKSSPDEKKEINNYNSKNDTLNSKNTLLETDESVHNTVQIPIIPSSNNINNILSQKNQSNSPKIDKMEVIGTYRESPDRYWVMDIQNVPKFEEIQARLSKECEKYEAVLPKLGLVCGCTYADEWYRVKVESITSEPIVHFIDYGNWLNCNKNVFKKLPDALQSLPGLVFLIELEKGTQDQYKTLNLESVKFTIEETSKTADGYPRVKIVDGIHKVTTNLIELEKPPNKKRFDKMGSSKIRCVMDTITPTSNGMLFFMPGEGTLRFASIVPEGNHTANECIEKIYNIDNSNSNPYEAKEGDLVLVTDKEGNDQRGRVISKLGSSYFIQLMDCGNVLSTDQVFAMPDDLKNLIELGVKITVEKIISEDQMKQIETCFFTINGEAKSNKWPCVIKDTKNQIIAKVSLEKPEKIMEWRPQYISLKSGSTVEISSISSSNSFYIRSVDAETEKKFLDMNMEMLEFTTKAKHFEIPPLPGELCCAKFDDDGCFYRAIVTSIENGKIFVLFVDFGNEQRSDLKDLKPLPESLKKVPFFSVKIKLKNVFTKSWNNMIKEYIGRLMSENIELTLTYEKSINNGVILREKVSGVVVNEFIEKSKDKINSINPVKPQALLSKKGEIFLDDDLKYTTITSGSVCVIALLYVSECEFSSNYTFWATVAELENFSYVNGELNTLISEHCAKISTPYEPSFRELCLAEFEGCWYRAMCAGSDGDFYKVFFVDFGNFCELKSSSIRKMIYEFLKAPALAMNCTLSDRDRLKGKPELTNEICGMLLSRINTLIKGVTVTTFEEDTFALKIPEVDAVLSG